MRRVGWSNCTRLRQRGELTLPRPLCLVRNRREPRIAQLNSRWHGTLSPRCPACPTSTTLTASCTQCKLTVVMKKTLGDRLRELRDARDLSLRELAKQLGDVTAAHLSDIEFGRRFPSEELLARLAKFFKVEETELRALDTRPPVEEMKRLARSEERRVVEECRSRWWADQ